MAIYTKQVKHQRYTSKTWEFYTQGLHPCFLDIETTGLSSRRDQVILSGFSSYGGKPETLLSSQFFCEDPQEEKELLFHYLNQLSKRDIWVSYNGDSFDLPFIKKRARHLGLAEELPLHYSLDLYQVFRWYSPFPKLLPDLKQKTIEDFLSVGRYRRDGISGKESVELYEEYLKKKDNRIRDVLLLHNSDDVCQLPKLLPAFDKLDLHQVMFRRGFPLSLEGKKVVIQKIFFEKGALTAEGSTCGIDGNYNLFEGSLEAVHSASDKLLTVRIPCGKLNDAVFVDLEPLDLDFAPLQDYPTYESGFLILKEGKEIHHRELNHLLKIIFTKLLQIF